MAEREQLEVWIAVGESGDYAVATDRDAAIENYGDNIGLDGALAVYHLSVDVPLPVAREASIVLADDAPVEIVATVEE